MKQESRDQAIKELMVSIRRSTEGSKCIDVYENLLTEISDKNVVDDAIADMNRFAGEFSRLCKDIDNMKNIDFISKMLTDEFIQPSRFFSSSLKNAKLYLLMSDILCEIYKYPVYEIEKKITLSNKNRLGFISHKENYSTQDVITVTKHFGDLSSLPVDKVKEMYELARRIVLLYNYMPAVVKAFIQTKRRSLDLDKNSTRFGK